MLDVDQTYLSKCSKLTCRVIGSKRKSKISRPEVVAQFVLTLHHDIPLAFMEVKTLSDRQGTPSCLNSSIFPCRTTDGSGNIRGRAGHSIWGP